MKPDWGLAIGRTCVAQRGSNDNMAIPGDARASMVVAGREPAEQTVST
jgi:hypothetical protein